MKKIAIIGAGRVGETTAQVLAEQQLCRELVLVDNREGIAQGVALDILQAAPFFDFDLNLIGSNQMSVIANANLVIITAGLARQPGMSRSDLLAANQAILDQIIDDVLHYAGDAMLLLVTNPVDTLTWSVYQRTGWDRQRVFGQAGVLDSSRFASFIAEETGFSVRDIHAWVIGGHGDTMVPLPDYCTIHGIPIRQFLSENQLAALIARTRQGGAEILALRKNSSAYTAPAAAIATMVDAIVHDRRRILPCVAILDGEYGERQLAMGVPAVLSGAGLESIIELPLNTTETALLHRSAEAIRQEFAQK